SEPTLGLDREPPRAHVNPRSPRFKNPFTRSSAGARRFPCERRIELQIEQKGNRLDTISETGEFTCLRSSKTWLRWFPSVCSSSRWQCGSAPTEAPDLCRLCRGPAARLGCDCACLQWREGRASR